jgi:hypothetical protein
MSLLAFIGVPLIFIGGCVTAAGFMRPESDSYISGYGPRLPIGSRFHREPPGRQGRTRRIKLGLKLCGIGAVLVFLASF